MIDIPNSFFPLDNIIESIHFNKIESYLLNLNVNNSNLLLVLFKKDENKIKKSTFEEFLLDNELWNDEELAEITNLKNKNGKTRLYEWVLSRILIKQGLMHYLKLNNIKNDINLDEITISTTNNNKPTIEILKQKQNNISKNIPFISISHSKNTIIIAFCEKIIGIDIESIKPHSFSWQKKIFPQQDSNKIFSFFKNQYIQSNDTIFTLIWSIKEATLKICEDNPLGLIPKIPIIINREENSIMTKHPLFENYFINYFSIIDESIIAITLEKENYVKEKNFCNT